MCSAGNLAFFGTTDGGLGLESLFIGRGSLSAAIGDNGDVSDESRMGTREDTLLNAVLNDRTVGMGHSSSTDAFLSTKESASSLCAYRGGNAVFRRRCIVAAASPKLKNV